MKKQSELGFSFKGCALSEAKGMGIMMKSNLEMKIYNLIGSKTEGDYWDFKQEWHKDNERLLHDILCFANTVHDRDCYIIIGVSDAGEIIGLNEQNRVKQAGIGDGRNKR